MTRLQANINTAHRNACEFHSFTIVYRVTFFEIFELFTLKIAFVVFEKIDSELIGGLWFTPLPIFAEFKLNSGLIYTKPTTNYSQASEQYWLNVNLEPKKQVLQCHDTPRAHWQATYNGNLHCSDL